MRLDVIYLMEMFNKVLWNIKSSFLSFFPLNLHGVHDTSDVSLLPFPSYSLTYPRMHTKGQRCPAPTFSISLSGPFLCLPV